MQKAAAICPNTSLSSPRSTSTEAGPSTPPPWTTSYRERKALSRAASYKKKQQQSFPERIQKDEAAAEAAATEADMTTTASAPHRSKFSSLFHSIPYKRTAQANPPRLVTTTHSFTLLPIPTPSLPASHPRPNTNNYSSSNNNGFGIPNSFKIFVRAFHRHPHAYLAQRKHEPLYAISFTPRDVTLHRGSREVTAPVGTYVHAGHWNPKKRPARVRLPVRTSDASIGGSAGGSAGGGGARLHPGLTVNLHPPPLLRVPYEEIIVDLTTKSFIVDVPSPKQGGKVRRERFEWRRSRSPAIGAAIASSSTGPISHSGFPPSVFDPETRSKTRIHHSGMKLVRLSTDAGRGGGDFATGGGEVVAVLYVGGLRRAKFSTRGYFMFQGTGAQGILGETFRMVAIMSAMGMWDRKRRRHGGD